MPKKELNFEETMQKLEETVKDLEKSDLNLEESIKKFEEGISLSKKCNEILEEAEKKITILIKQENGTTKEENF